MEDQLKPTKQHAELTKFWHQIESPIGHLLVYKWHGSAKEKAPYQIVIKALDEKGNQISSIGRYPSEGSRDAAFSNVEEDANKLVKKFMKLNSQFDKEAKS
jgi:hypothetical protein